MQLRPGKLQKKGMGGKILEKGAKDSKPTKRELGSEGSCRQDARWSRDRFLEGRGPLGRAGASAARGGAPAALVSALPQCLTHSRKSTVNGRQHEGGKKAGSAVP